MQDRLDVMYDAIKPYIPIPVTIKMIGTDNPEGLWVWSVMSTSDHSEIAVYLREELLTGPDDALRYLAADKTFVFSSDAAGYLYYRYRPDQAQMRKIRPLLQETGDYPFRQSRNETYNTLAVDKLIREVSPYRLTQEIADWYDSFQDPFAKVSWRGRLAVQENDTAI